MDATLTNLSTSPFYIPGPNIELAAAGDPNGNHIKVLRGITVSDLDGNPIIKTRVLAGELSVSVTPGAEDAAGALQGALSFNSMERYTVANLPTGFSGRIAYATNGRTGAEGAGAGTGCPVVFSNAQWRRFEDMAIIAA